MPAETMDSGRIEDGSSVATRRNSVGVLGGPWLESHGYCHAVAPRPGAHAVVTRPGVYAIAPRLGVRTTTLRPGVRAIGPRRGVRAVLLSPGVRARRRAVLSFGRISGYRA